jgi:hypothetical protein
LRKKFSSSKNERSILPHRRVILLYGIVSLSWAWGYVCLKTTSNFDSFYSLCKDA